MDGLGQKLRVLRKERGLSLSQLAERVGCSPSYLSMVENEKIDPSVSRLKVIAEGLGTTIVGLFQEPDGHDVVLREADRPRVAFPGSRLRIEILIPRSPGQQLDARLTVVSPGGGSEGDYSHSGVEFGVVVKGELELTVAGVIYHLRPGDSFYFPSTRDHRFKNPSDEETQVVWVNHPPSW